MCLGGAVKHVDYRPQKVDTYGQVMRAHRPDIVWFMTDPRFYSWLWDIEDEVRAFAPMVYYHVWDNYPYPDFNAPFYNSNDVVVTISKLTDDIVSHVSPDVKRVYLPHSVDLQIFRKLPENEVSAARNPFCENEENLLFSGTAEMQKEKCLVL